MEIIIDKILAQDLNKMTRNIFGDLVADMPINAEEVMKKIKKEKFLHKDLSSGRWQRFSFVEQMANIGAEIGRAINWSKKDKSLSQSALYRGLELLDLTIEDKKNKRRLKELCRLREVVADYFCFDNIYKSTDTEFNNYFYLFNYAAALK